jgi:excisionase family DNA binding protein
MHMKKKQDETTSGPGLEPWVGLEVAATHLGISKVTLRRWIKDRRLSPKRTPGGEFRFRLSELDELLD